MNKQLKRKMAFLIVALMFLNIGVGAYADTMKSDLEDEIVNPIQNDIEITGVEKGDIPLEEVEEPIEEPVEEPEEDIGISTEEPEELQEPEEETEAIVEEPKQELTAIPTPGVYTSDPNSFAPLKG